MSIQTLAQKAASLFSAAVISASASASPADSTRDSDTSAHIVSFQQIRNATIKLRYGDTTFLVDPMLGPKGSYTAAPGAFNEQIRNPTVDLPIPIDEVMKADAVIVTHLHLDHWDQVAKERLPKDIPIFAQNDQDAERIRSAGFRDVHALNAPTEFRGFLLTRTNGQHGSDEAMEVRGKMLGTVHGIVFQRPHFKSVYVAGDTVWNKDVEAAITTYKPDVVVLNTGYVRFRDIEGAIIMGKEDLYRASEAAPNAYVVASHMEALGHATQTRKELAEFISEKKLDPNRVLIPADGQGYEF
ncbi:MBL fold metallo-hydrolase [Paraburkholderia sp. JHI869]|uniref:MBL fold metallo-hydrolase n=1 Tax=Paraburkholderia sp. JHI869 TaxID=3112959 RepID=UPI003175BBC1